MTAPYYGGMWHPGVIQDPGSGAAIAGGLQNVLAALLQRAQLAQNAQAFESQQAQREADTQETRARAGLYGAQTQKALRPDTPEPKPGHIITQPDGSVVLVDPITGKVTPVPGVKGIPNAHNIDPNSPAGVAARVAEYQRTTGASQQAAAAREQAVQRQSRIAQGQAILGSAAKGGPNDPVLDAFGQAFRSVRAGNKKMHPGEIAYYAWEQLKQLRPDLIPAKPRAPNALDELLSGGSESPQAGASPTPQAAAPASLVPLTPEEQQTARTDPNFAKWLKNSKGYSEQAWAQ